MNSYIQVFGCTEDKVVHRIDMGVADVVRMRIHPRKLDLFEPEPIHGDMLHAVPLMFSPLRRFSLAYTQGNQGVVAMAHDELVQSISGPVHSRSNQAVSMEREKVELSLDRHRFDEHFLNYLQWVNTARFTIDPGWKQGNVWCLPASDCSQMQLIHQLLIYDPGKSTDYYYAGSMFEPVHFRCLLPPEIERVFELFARFHPVVFGPALTRVLCEVPVGNEQVDFIVDNQGLPDYSQMELYLHHLRQIRADTIIPLDDTYDRASDTFARAEYKAINATKLYYFRLHGTNYRLFVVKEPRAFDPRAPRAWIRSDFSAYQLESEHPGEMIASRIALYDLARKQARLLGLSKEYRATVGGKRVRPTKDQLRSISIDVVNVLWHSRDGRVINQDAVPDGVSRYRAKRGTHDYP